MELLIPAALTEDGRIVHALEGSKDRNFRCPGCLEPVVWRQCVERRSHFAHRPDAPCSESQIHISAKRFAAQQINDWLQGRGRHPMYCSPCEQCGTRLEAVPIPRPKMLAELEYRLPSGRKPDIFCGFAVEIFNTHRVDAEKSAVLNNEDKVSWIEIEAQKVLDDPFEWIVRQAGGLFRNRRKCLGCLDRTRNEVEVMRRDASAILALSREASDKLDEREKVTAEREVRVNASLRIAEDMESNMAKAMSEREKELREKISAEVSASVRQLNACKQELSIRQRDLGTVQQSLDKLRAKESSLLAELSVTGELAKTYSDRETELHTRQISLREEQAKLTADMKKWLWTISTDECDFILRNRGYVRAK